MEITDLGRPRKSLTTSMVGYPSNSWASCQNSFSGTLTVLYTTAGLASKLPMHKIETGFQTNLRQKMSDPLCPQKTDHKNKTRQ